MKNIIIVVPPIQMGKYGYFSFFFTLCPLTFIKT